MPRLSIIVAVHNGAMFVRQALLSATEQRFADVEVIVVDDASTDDTAAVIADVVRHDPRVRAVTLPQRAGSGGARNAGLDAASGEFVLFLDADDSLAPGSLQLLVDRLDASGADVLVFDHLQVMWNGSKAPSGDAEILASAPTDAFALTDYPALLDTRRVAWNKVYRRDFLAQKKMRFPTGVYEGIPWSYAALLQASRVAAEPTAAYNYARRRPGSLLATTVGAHMEALQQWERVFAFLDTHGGLEHWRGPVFDAMAGALLGKARRSSLSEQQREEFFAAASELAASRLPPGHVPPEGVAGRRQQRLVAGDDSVLEPSAVTIAKRRGKRVVRGVARRALRLLRRATDRSRSLAYRMERRKPIDPRLVVLSSEISGAGAGAPAEIASQLQRLLPDRYRFVWLVPEGASVAVRGAATVAAATARANRALASAAYIVYEGTLPADMIKRPGQVAVQTMHSHPLKRIGVDLTAYPVAAEQVRFRKLLAQCDAWDVVLSPGQYASEIWQRAFPSSYRIMETGAPRLDVYHRDPDAFRAAARNQMGVPADATVVLYAPVGREYKRPSDVPVDLDRLARALPEGFVLAVRPPRGTAWEDAVAPLVDSGRAIDAARVSVEHACMAADLLVTDYSAIMFEVATLDRPIVILADDLPTFERVRGTYIDLRQDGPGAVVSGVEELAEVLAQGRHDTADTAAARDRFRRRFCGVVDGGSAERAVRAIFLQEDVAAPAWSTAGKTTAAPTATS